jgi:ankyrin repeat protein
MFAFKIFSDGSTAVHRACCNGNHEALCILIQYHADVSVQDVHGRAPIHWAAIAPKTECLKVYLLIFLFNFAQPSSSICKQQPI